MKLYPYTQAFIINDNVFQAYGGSLANTSTEQRKAAYWMAERAVTEDIGTFLKPTTVTGTFSPHEPFLLDYTHVNAVHSVAFLKFDGSTYYTVNGTGNETVAIRNNVLGIIDIDYYYSLCGGCGSRKSSLYQLQVSYNAGLPTGTTTMPDVLLALTTYSQIILNEIIGYGNESPGDIGVEEYQNQGYRENRIGLFRTVYGSSPKALFAHKLLTHLREYRAVGL